MSLAVLSFLEQQYGMSNRPYNQTIYPAPGSPNSAQVAPPGPGFQPEAGHLSKSGWAFVNSTVRPSTPEVSGNGSDADMDYLFTWSRNPMGFYQMTWTDCRGNVVRKENNSTDAGTWAQMQYSYNTYDQVSQIVSPKNYTKTYSE